MSIAQMQALAENHPDTSWWPVADRIEFASWLNGFCDVDEDDIPGLAERWQDMQENKAEIDAGNELLNDLDTIIAMLDESPAAAHLSQCDRHEIAISVVFYCDFPVQPSDIPAIIEEFAETADCPTCHGTGEGPADGVWCSACAGKGARRPVELAE